MAKIIDAVALFFDDVRHEVGNKLSFMGQYNADIMLGAGQEQTISRLIFVVIIKITLGESPKDVRVTIRLPDKKALELEPDWPPPIPASYSAEDHYNAQLVFPFGPLLLRAGTNISVELRADDRIIHAGQLKIGAQEQGPTVASQDRMSARNPKGRK